MNAPTGTPPRRGRLAVGIAVILLALGSVIGGTTGLITNWSEETRPYAAPHARVLAAAKEAAQAMPRWTPTGDGEVLRYEARTALVGFVDDVRVDVSAASSESCTVHVRSASRVGLSDFGTNGRRIRAFFAELDARLAR